MCTIDHDLQRMFSTAASRKKMYSLDKKNSPSRRSETCLYKELDVKMWIKSWSWNSYLYCVISTGCPKINFTFLNDNNVRTNIRIAIPAIILIEETCRIILAISKFNYNVYYVKRKKHTSILRGELTCDSHDYVLEKRGRCLRTEGSFLNVLMA